MIFGIDLYNYVLGNFVEFLIFVFDWIISLEILEKFFDVSLFRVVWEICCFVIRDCNLLYILFNVLFFSGVVLIFLMSVLNFFIDLLFLRVFFIVLNGIIFFLGIWNVVGIFRLLCIVFVCLVNIVSILYVVVFELVFLVVVLEILNIVLSGFWMILFCLRFVIFDSVFNLM